MTRYKLISLDVDGTLIGDGAYPTARVAEAVAAARNKGVQVALGTGRASEACYHLLNALTLDGLHIFFDGAAIVNWPSNDIVYLQALPPRAAAHLIELCREHDLFLEIYAHDFYFIEQDDELARHQREKLQLRPIITDLMTLVNRIKIVKGQIIAANAEQKKRADIVTKEMQAFCKLSWSFDYSNGMYFGNAISKFVSKGNALRELADYLGIDIRDTLAVGDSYNDMPIFRVANTKVAMGHSPDALKEMADWVAPSVSEDGVAATIEKFILSE
ncbi:HAD family hydrolase [Anaerolineales bacterium HSG6]|nr:HAD family hydrolase [Anaerolineales bacterium HSG6]MDM8530877.1 HAD family hydrolase [Anaerolineales bacterium HSG25]